MIVLPRRMVWLKLALNWLALLLVSGCRNPSAIELSSALPMQRLTNAATPTVSPTAAASPQSGHVIVDHEAALAGINAFTQRSPEGLTFQELTLMINASNADRYVAVYQDGWGASYCVDPITYRVVQFDPSPIQRQMPGDPLSIEQLRRIAREVALYSPAFNQRESFLNYTEGIKGDVFFFNWTDPHAEWTYNPPRLQVGIRVDGELVSYMDTLGFE